MAEQIPRTSSTDLSAGNLKAKASDLADQARTQARVQYDRRVGGVLDEIDTAKNEARKEVRKSDVAGDLGIGR